MIAQAGPTAPREIPGSRRARVGPSRVPGGRSWGTGGGADGRSIVRRIQARRVLLALFLATALVLGGAHLPFAASVASNEASRPDSIGGSGTGPVASSPPSARPGGQPRILGDYQRFVLPNGLILLVMENHELPLVDFRLVIKAGAASDPRGKEGLAALTAALLRQGTRSKSAPQFSEAVDFLGGQLESGADTDRTTVSGEFLARDFAQGLKLLGEMVLDPAFGDEELERARKQTLATIAADLDDPEAIAAHRFARFLYGDHPYARAVEGTKESVPKLSREDIAGFYASGYGPGTAILSIVGDIAPTAAAASARETFGRWEKKTIRTQLYPDPPAIKGRRVLIVDKPDLNQTQIRIGTVGIRRADPSYFPVQIAGTILGGGFTSWLNQEIREKRGLSYGAGCRFETRLAPGPFVVSTFTKNETARETINVALETLGRFKRGEFTASDLEKAQSYRAGQYPLSVETTEQIAAQLADLEFYGLGREFVDRQIERLRAVTLADLKSVTPRIPVEDYVMVVVTNAAKVRPQLEGLGTITVVPYDGAP